MRTRNADWQCIGGPGLAVLMMIFLLAPVACSGVGRIIAPEERIPFNAGGVTAGHWQDMDATVWYRLTTDGQPAGKVRISGSVSPKSRVAQLRVSIRFLDAEGKILGSEQIYSSGYRDSAVGGEFNRTLDLPAATEALALTSYSQAREGYR